MTETKYGIISDIHNDPRIIVPAIRALKQIGIDKLILNGDIGERQQTLEQSQNYIAMILDVAGKSSLETFVQPGSHESIQAYKPVLDWAVNKYSNLVDTVEESSSYGKGHRLVFIPGSDSVSGGEFIFGNQLESGIYIATTRGSVEMESEEQFNQLVSSGIVKGLFYYKNINDIKEDITDPEKTVVVCHVPRKFDGLENCIDMAEFGEATEDFNLNNQKIEKNSVFPLPIAERIKKAGAPVELKKENRGNKDLKNLYEELGITKAVSGHFHESGHRANDSYGNPLKPGELTRDLFWNSGHMDIGQTGILTIGNEGRVKYDNIQLSFKK